MLKPFLTSKFQQMNVLIDYSLNMTKTSCQFLQFLGIIFLMISVLSKKYFVLHYGGFL